MVDPGGSQCLRGQGDRLSLTPGEVKTRFYDLPVGVRQHDTAIGIPPLRTKVIPIGVLPEIQHEHHLEPRRQQRWCRSDQRFTSCLAAGSHAATTQPTPRVLASTSTSAHQPSNPPNPTSMASVATHDVAGARLPACPASCSKYHSCSFTPLSSKLMRRDTDSRGRVTPDAPRRNSGADTAATSSLVWTRYPRYRSRWVASVAADHPPSKSRNWKFISP